MEVFKALLTKEIESVFLIFLTVEVVQQLQQMCLNKFFFINALCLCANRNRNRARHLHSLAFLWPPDKKLKFKPALTTTSIRLMIISYLYTKALCVRAALK
jgi:hypothetical protein